MKETQHIQLTPKAQRFNQDVGMELPLSRLCNATNLTSGMQMFKVFSKSYSPTKATQQNRTIIIILTAQSHNCLKFIATTTTHV